MLLIYPLLDTSAFRKSFLSHPWITWNKTHQ